MVCVCFLPLPLWPPSPWSVDITHASSTETPFFPFPCNPHPPPQVVNRTASTLTNLTVELATMGDLRLIERPQSHTIGPHDQRTIKANIKVGNGCSHG